MLNLFIGVGRLGSDPTMRYTPSGNAVTTFSIATNRSFANGEGDRVQQTEWVNVVCWRRLAEVCNEHLSKGRLVAVIGRTQTRSWEDDGGHKNYRTEVVAQTIRFLDRRAEGDEPEEIRDEDEDLPY